MTPELWALCILAAGGTFMIGYALLPDSPRAERHPGRLPLHAEWTMHSPTDRLTGPSCSCAVLLLDGRLIEPAKHYAGCPKVRPGDRRL